MCRSRLFIGLVFKKDVGANSEELNVNISSFRFPNGKDMLSTCLQPSANFVMCELHVEGKNLLVAISSNGCFYSHTYQKYYFSKLLNYSLNFCVMVISFFLYILLSQVHHTPSKLRKLIIIKCLHLKGFSFHRPPIFNLPM